MSAEVILGALPMGQSSPFVTRLSAGILCVLFCSSGSLEAKPPQDGIIAFGVSESTERSTPIERPGWVVRRFEGVFLGKRHNKSEYVVVFHRLQPETLDVKKKDRFGAYRRNRKLDDALNKTVEFIQVPAGLYVLSGVAVHDNSTFLMDDGKLTCLPAGNTIFSVESGKTTYIGDLELFIDNDLFVSVIAFDDNSETRDAIEDVVKDVPITDNPIATPDRVIDEAFLESSKACKKSIRMYYGNRSKLRGERQFSK